MNLTHALNCKKEGLIKHGYEQHRDHCATMANMARRDVEVEPMKLSSQQCFSSASLFKDNGIWEAERAVFFNNRIVNANVPSYSTKIGKPFQETTLCIYTQNMTMQLKIEGECSIEGVLHKEYAAFQKRTSKALAS